MCKRKRSFCETQANAVRFLTGTSTKSPCRAKKTADNLQVRTPNLRAKRSNTSNHLHTRRSGLQAT
jgi:hypothetical protein